MSKSALPLPLPPAPTRPDTARSNSTGEGAQTALAAMIRKRKMGENHFDPDEPQPLPQQAGPDA